MIRLLRSIVSKPIMDHRDRLLKGFLKRAYSCQSSQAHTLKVCLSIIQGSQFSRDYYLEGVSEIAELQQRLPIGDYDRVRPYIDQVAAGSLQALFAPQIKLEMFAKTSGTTSASKLVPVTQQHLENYRTSMNIWSRSAADVYPEVPKSLSVLNLASSWQEEQTAAGYHCGSITGLLFRRTHNMMRAINAIPPDLAMIKNTELKYYLMLRVALANPRIAVLTTANPTTLLRLARWMDRWHESLIRDIYDGNLRAASEYDPQILRSVRSKIRPDRQRAADLEKAASEGHLYPKDAWPHLCMLAVWMGGTLGSYIRYLPQYYGETGLRDHGLSASEAKITIPFENNTASGLLNIDGGFFEFQKPGTDTVLLAHELVKGERYNLVLSNLAGLLRYNISDIVECTGHYGEAPYLKFLNKGAQISNLTGEKLSAHQIDQSISQSLKKFRPIFGQFALLPQVADPPYYLMVGDLHGNEEALEKFLQELDSALQQSNIEYADKRQSQRLGPVQFRPVSAKLWENIRNEHIAKNKTNLEQYKQPVLILDERLTATIMAALES